MKGIALDNCTLGTVSSREDGSVAFRVITAELRPSERGVVMDYHGKACAVTILPHEGEPPEIVKVQTERVVKSPSQRLHAVLYLVWKEKGQPDTFESFYEKQMNVVIETYKAQLPDRFS